MANPTLKSTTKPLSQKASALVNDLEEMGRTLQGVGRNLLDHATAKVKVAAEDSLAAAEDTLIATQKKLRKLRMGMKKPDA